MSAAALRVVSSVYGRTWMKAFRRPVVLSFSLVQPMIWMLLFGFLFERYRVERPGGAIRYLDFLLPGICAMTVLFGASQSGIELIRDIQTHFLGRLLDTPAARPLLLLGKLTADVTRLLAQAAVVFLLGLLVGARISISLPGLAVSLSALGLFGFAFAALSCTLALLTRAPESMAVFVHVVNMPLLFTSTAFVPSRQMPAFLASVSQVNPLTLAVGALRGSLLFGEIPSVRSLLPLVLLALFLFGIASAAMTRAARD
jgi:ABC-2 type transport system permease protein